MQASRRRFVLGSVASLSALALARPSVVAAQTTNVRVAPNVANLPLRPPVVLARSVN